MRTVSEQPSEQLPSRKHKAKVRTVLNHQGGCLDSRYTKGSGCYQHVTSYMLGEKQQKLRAVSSWRSSEKVQQNPEKLGGRMIVVIKNC